MSPWTCTQVLEDIELYAAGEGDAESRAAIERHVAGCASCTAALEQARELVGLVSLQLREPQAIERLQTRIHAEARRRRGSRGLFVLRAAAMAAMLLLTVGLYFWLGELREPRRRDGAESTVAAANLGPNKDAVYAVRNSQEMDVERGTVLFRVPAGDADAKPFNVRTPGGIATAERAEFTIDVSGAAPVAVRVLSGKVTIHNDWGQVDARRGESVLISATGVPSRKIEDLGLRFGRSYVPVKVRKTAGVPALPLPLGQSTIANLPAAAKDLETLRTQGFARLANAGGADLVSSYRMLDEQNLPVMITSDTVLRLVRMQLANLLRDLEERHFAFDLARLTAGLLAEVAEQKMPASNASEWLEARKLALTYLAVGERLLHPQARTPAEVDAAAIETIVGAIDAGRAFAQLPVFGYPADFHDFRPTGHYTSSETLQRYYRARSWFGRMPLVLMGGEGWQVSAVLARRQTMAAALIASALPQATLADGRGASAVWERLDTVTSFFAGAAADCGPPQYSAALSTGTFRLGDLAEPAAWERFRSDLIPFLPRPFFANAISLKHRKTPAEMLTEIAPNTGFRLLSQRSAADIVALGKLVYPNVGPGYHKTAFTAVELPNGKLARGLPRGLDLMSLLDNMFAREFLKESGDHDYGGNSSVLSYGAACEFVYRDLKQLDVVDWNRDLNWAWLDILGPLQPDAAAGSPTYMMSAAYQASRLNTALASWTQMRGDTVLYTRKADMEPVKTLKGNEMAFAPLPKRGGEALAYLEPLPELYARQLALTRMTAKELTALDVLTAEARQGLADLEQSLATMLALAEKELDNEPLSATDQDTLRHLPKRLLHLAGGNEPGPMVVTIATDATGQWVLQEALGKPDLALFAVRLPDARVMVVAGPVQSYFEFKRPLAAALTQETWVELLQATPGPIRPEWLSK